MKGVFKHVPQNISGKRTARIYRISLSHISRGFHVFNPPRASSTFLRVAPDERIPHLAAQLIRSEHPLVIETVAEQLRQAIDEYVEIATRRAPEAGAEASLNETPAQA
jgi:hypothetical protein